MVQGEGGTGRAAWGKPELQQDDPSGSVRRGIVRVNATVWVFGYALVELVYLALERENPLAMLLANIPLGAVGFSLSLLIFVCIVRTQSHSTLWRWVVGITGALLGGLIQTLADDIWLRFLAQTVVPGWKEWAAPWDPQRLFIIYVLYTWTFLLAISLTVAFKAQYDSAQRTAQAADLAISTARAEAAALRLQLNPHFLFNALNGVASLVVCRQAEEAAEMIERLCVFLRQSMLTGPCEFVPVREEIETIAAYLDVEKVRFGPKLIFDVSCLPDCGEFLIPPLILQPLVENAVKHGISRTKGEAGISVVVRQSNRRLILSVENTCDRQTGVGEATRGEGIGISNTQKRLSTHFGVDVTLECERLPDRFRAVISIPLSAMQEAV